MHIHFHKGPWRWQKKKHFFSSAFYPTIKVVFFCAYFSLALSLFGSTVATKVVALLLLEKGYKFLFSPYLSSDFDASKQSYLFSFFFLLPKVSRNLFHLSFCAMQIRTRKKRWIDPLSLLLVHSSVVLYYLPFSKADIWKRSKARKFFLSFFPKSLSL